MESSLTITSRAIAERLFRGEVTATKVILLGEYSNYYEEISNCSRILPKLKTIKLCNFNYHKQDCYFSYMFNRLNYEYIRALEFETCTFHSVALATILSDIKVESLSFISVDIRQTGHIDTIKYLSRSKIIKEFNLSNILDDNPNSRVMMVVKENTYQIECVNNRNYKDQKYIDFTDNYILRYSNLDYLKPVITRNMRILDRIRQISLTLIMIRQYRNTYLDSHPKEIIIAISRIIYSFRSDHTYLKLCDSFK